MKITVTRTVAALALVASIAFAGGARTTAQQSATDIMLRSRSQEQPQPSARRIALPADNPLEVLHVLGNVYMVAGGPSNVAVQIGPEGVLLVDTATVAVSDHLLQAIRTLTDAPISYIINTTPDADHFGGNEKIAAAGENPTVAGRGLTGPVVRREADAAAGNAPGGGFFTALQPQGAIVFSHENMLNRMSAPTGVASPEPFALWPTSTFFTALKAFSFNDEAVEMRHLPAAHTDGDILVFFRGSDVVAAGDIINTLQYPAFDAKRGGTLRGILDGLNAVIAITVPRINQMAGTRVVPGHGRILNEADVVEYRDMMTIIYERVRDAAVAGKSLEQIKAMKPTLDYDGLYATPEWTGDMLIDAIYREVKDPARTTSKRDGA